LEGESRSANAAEDAHVVLGNKGGGKEVKKRVLEVMKESENCYSEYGEKQGGVLSSSCVKPTQ